MKRKIMITYMILLLICMIATGFIAHQFLNSTYEQNLQEKLITNLNLINDTLLLVDKENEKINYFHLANKFSRKINERITFITTDGKVLADSKNNSVIFEDFSNKPEVMLAAKGRLGISERVSTISGERCLYIASPYIEIDQKKVIVRLEASLSEILRLNKSFRKYMIISTILGLSIALGVGFFYINKIIKPIKALTNASKSISNGEFNQIVIVNSKDEVEELANHFNIMSLKLKRMIYEINKKNRQMNDIVNSMVNGIIAIDNHDKLILFNAKAEQLLNIKGKGLQENELLTNIQNEELCSLLKETKATKSRHEKEIKIRDNNKRILKIYTSPIENGENGENDSNSYGALSIIEDVSIMRKLETLRNEFVSNVSHELRTPLTSISGFIETLKSWEILEDSEIIKILDIIDMEADRLKRLINSLLTLSEIENIKIPQNISNINIDKIIHEVLMILEPISKERKVTIETSIQHPISPLIGNEDWFKQMILNLLDNAIKYSMDNGKVLVNIFEKDNYIHISIKDNGIGIPKEDIPRILERFYRVDKARSRKLGGTGLGLAIVKHVVKQMNGYIEIESEVGQGSEFHIKLPC